MNIEKYVGEKRSWRQWKFLLLLIGMTILVTYGFSYANWSIKYGTWAIKIVCLLLLAFILIHWPKKSNRYNFRTEVLILTFLPLISSINTYIYYGQSFIDSFNALSFNFVWIIYFVLHKYKVQESTILRMFLWVSLFIAAVQIIQQFTYPNVLFGGYSEEFMIERGVSNYAASRNGLWRFLMHENGYFTAPILFAVFIWARKKTNIKFAFIIAICLVSIYLSLTRQVIASCILALFLSFFLGKKSGSVVVRAMILAIVLFAFLYSYYDVLFGSLTEQTGDDLSGNYVRFLAADYFWNESVKHPLAFLFGYGAEGQTGAYNQLINYLKSVMGFFTGDVGFIGKIFTNGVVYVIMCYVLLWKLFFTFKNSVPTYIRMFVIFGAVMSIMIFPMTVHYQFFVWALLLYVADLHINEGKLQKRKITNA